MKPTLDLFKAKVICFNGLYHGIYHYQTINWEIMFGTFSKHLKRI